MPVCRKSTIQCLGFWQVEQSEDVWETCSLTGILLRSRKSDSSIFAWFYAHRFITAIHVLLLPGCTRTTSFCCCWRETFDPIWRYVLRGSFGRLKASSIYGFGWVGAEPCVTVDESSKLQKCVVFCVSVNNFDRNHLNFWVSQVRVLYNISDFLLKPPPPKKRNNNMDMGSVTIFFFPPLLISDGLFQKWRFLVALLLWHGPSAHPVLCGDL